MRQRYKLKRALGMALAVMAATSVGNAAAQNTTIPRQEDNGELALWSAGPAHSVSELLVMLRDADPERRSFAAFQLGERGGGRDEVISALIEGLRDPDETARVQAVVALAMVGEPAGPALAAALNDTAAAGQLHYESLNGGTRAVDVTVQDMAFVAIALSDYQDADLMSAATDERSLLMRALLMQRSPSSSAVLTALREGGSGLREEALRAAPFVSLPSRRLVRAIARAASVEETADLAACALQGMGDRGRNAFANLSRSDSTRAAWWRARYEVSPSELLTALNSSNEDTRGDALRRLSDPNGVCGDAPSIAPASTDTGGALLAALTDLMTNERKETSLAAAAALSNATLVPAPMKLGAIENFISLLGRDDLELADATALVRQIRSILPSTADSPPVSVNDQSARLLAQAPQAAVAHADTTEDSSSSAWQASQRAEFLGQVIALAARLSLSGEQVRESSSLLAQELAATESDSLEIDDAPPGPLVDGIINALAASHQGALLRPAVRRFLLAHAENTSASNLLVSDALAMPAAADRVAAAAELANVGVTDPRLLGILSQAVRSARPTEPAGLAARSAMRAAESLAHSGSEGLEALVSLTLDARTSPFTQRLVVQAIDRSQSNDSVTVALQRIADGASIPATRAQAREVLAIRAAAAEGLDAHAASLLQFGRIEELADILSTHPEVRIDPARLLDVAGRDDRLRLHAIRELSPGDERRDAALLELLQSEPVQPYEGYLVATIDPSDRRAIAWLAQAIRHRSPTALQLERIAASLASRAPEIASAIVARVRDGDASGASYAWGDLDTPELRAALEQALSDPEFYDRLAAAARLWDNSDWTTESRAGGIVYEFAALQASHARVGRVLDWLHPRIPEMGPSSNPGAYYINLRNGPSGRLPQFPWPPPPGFRRQELQRELIAPSSATLGEVGNAISDALSAASNGHYEQGYFAGPPDGFVLLARMERVYRNGHPAVGRARWLEANSTMSFIDIVSNLFFERPGYFRVIAFVVTADGEFLPGPDDGIPRAEAGARTLPDQLARQPMGSRKVYAVVYGFERRSGGAIRVWLDDAPAPLQHLTAAGVMGALRGARR